MEGIQTAQVKEYYGNKLSATKIFFYGMGDFANNMVYVTVMGFFMYYSSQINLISTAVIGTISLLARCIDAFLDIGIGQWSNNTRTKLGRFRPWIIAGVIPTLILFYLSFSVLPADWSSNTKNVYACVIYVLLWCSFSTIYVPYSALGSVISVDVAERGKLAASRLGLGCVGAILLSFTLNFVEFFGKGNEALGWKYTVILFGIIAAVFWWANAAVQKEVVIPDEKNDEGSKENSSLINFFKNINYLYVIVLIGMFAYGFQMFARAGVLAYYFQYYVGNVSALTLFLIFNYGGISVGCLFAPYVLRKIIPSKGKLMVITAVGSGGLIVILTWLNYNSMYVAFLALTLISQILIGMFNTCLWSMIGDTVEYTQWKTGYRNEGLAMSLAVCIMKVGMGIGTFLFGVIMAAYGFIPGAATQVPVGNSVINAFMTWGAGGMLIIIGLFYIPYNLDEHTHRKIVAELRERGSLKISG